MLVAADRVLCERRDVWAAVSVADPALERAIYTHLQDASLDITARRRLVVTGASVRELLCASSHSLLSSGTVTLEAACLGVPGTIGFTLFQEPARLWRFILSLILRREKIGDHKIPVPVGLPNVLMAYAGRDDRPYEEFTDSAYHAEDIADSIVEKLPKGPYSADAPPMLPDREVEFLRTLIRPPDGGGSLEIVADRILGVLGHS
jgi:lipid A disaccharide synthetase